MGFLPSLQSHEKCGYDMDDLKGLPHIKVDTINTCILHHIKLLCERPKCANKYRPRRPSPSSKTYENGSIAWRNKQCFCQGSSEDRFEYLLAEFVSNPRARSAKWKKTEMKQFEYSNIGFTCQNVANLKKCTMLR